MRKRIIKIIIICICCSLIACLIGVSLMFLTDVGLADSHRIFSNISEFDSIDSIVKVSEKHDIHIYNLYTEIAVEYQYVINKSKIKIYAYVFEDLSSAMAYFNKVMKTNGQKSAAYSQSTFLFDSKYCIYKDNYAIYCTTTAGSKKLQTFIKILDSNLSDIVKIKDEE